MEDILSEEGFFIYFEKQGTGEGVNDQGEPLYEWVPIYETQSASMPPRRPGESEALYRARVKAAMRKGASENTTPSK